MTHFIETYGQMLIEAIFVHLAYVLTSVAAATVVALVLGVLLSRVPGIARNHNGYVSGHRPAM